MRVSARSRVSAVSQWSTYFSAQVGAGAALSGLVFVALSINLRQILSASSLVGRAAEALLVLLLPVIVGLLALAPSTSGASASPILVFILVVGAAVVVIIVRARHDTGRSTRDYALRVIFVAGAVLVEAMGGLLVVTQSSAGPAWLADGGIVCMLAGVAEAWVLLVEILR